MLKAYKSKDQKKLLIEIDTQDVNLIKSITDFLIEKTVAIKELPGVQYSEDEPTPQKELEEIKPVLKINSLIEFYEALGNADSEMLKNYAQTHNIDSLNHFSKEDLIRIAKACIRFSDQEKTINFTEASPMELRKFIRSFRVASQL